jgi:hypothetical protein
METNGVPIIGKHIAGDDWEIVYDGPVAFIGRVVEDLDGWVTLSPIYQYVSKVDIREVPGGLEYKPNKRTAFPVEMLPSIDRRRIRPTQRQSLKDIDEYDRTNIFDKLVNDAEDIRRKFMAGRLHLTLTDEMPKVPPPGAAGGIA